MCNKGETYAIFAIFRRSCLQDWIFIVTFALTCNSTSTYFMEQIIGRTSEIQQLESLATSGRAEFVALYGRRRVGKTFLINSVFEEQFAFRMTGVIDGTLEDQFTPFEDAMDDYGYEMPEKPKNWMSAFVMLDDLFVRSL